MSNEWVTIATYDTLPDAYIALGRLQNEAIEAQLADQNLVQMDWLYSIAVGGIKLQVKGRDAPKAMELLARDDSDFLENL